MMYHFLFSDDHDVLSFISHSLTPPKEAQVTLLTLSVHGVCIGNRMNASAFRDLWARVMF